MKRNSRLSLALHTLGHMALEPDRRRTSAEIAAHAGTNPVVVRRVLGRLRDAGLLQASKGHAGGWSLARAPQGITLADVYRALDERIVAPGTNEDPPACAVEAALLKKTSAVMEEIEARLVAQLAATTIAEICGAEPSAAPGAKGDRAG